MLVNYLLYFAALAAASVIDPAYSLKARSHVQARQEITVTEQDVENFSLYAEYSTAAYCNPEAVAGTLVTCSTGDCATLAANNVTYVADGFHGPTTDITGYVAVDDVRREIVLAVRGSSSLLNWLVNLDYKLQWVPLTLFGQVHAGFLRGWNEISADVYVALAKATLEHPEYRIVATGHSLGGAVSTIGAAYLRSRGYAVDMYNYGSPRVGNFAFASFVTNQPGAEYRVTDRNDPVPQLPPIAWGYSHISPEYWLSGELSTGPTYPLDEIKVCQGPLNLACNGGTDDLTLEALQTHAFYFGVITCNPNIVPPTQDAAEVEGVLEGLAQPPTPEDVQAQQDALGQAVPPTAGDAAPGVDTSTQQEGGSGSKDDVSQDDDVSAQDAISDELELAAAQDRFPARDTVTVTDAVTEERTVAQTWACWARKQFQ